MDDDNKKNILKKGTNLLNDLGFDGTAPAWVELLEATKRGDLVAAECLVQLLVEYEVMLRLGGGVSEDLGKLKQEVEALLPETRELFQAERELRRKVELESDRLGVELVALKREIEALLPMADQVRELFQAEHELRLQLEQEGRELEEELRRVRSELERERAPVAPKSWGDAVWETTGALLGTAVVGGAMWTALALGLVITGTVDPDPWMSLALNDRAKVVVEPRPVHPALEALENMMTRAEVARELEAVQQQQLDALREAMAERAEATMQPAPPAPAPDASSNP